MTRNPAPSVPAALAPAVLAALPGLRGKAWTPLDGGRVNRLWRVGDAVVKHYDPAAASPLFANDPRAEARVLSALAGSSLAPALLAAEADWIAYGFEPGHSWTGGDSAEVATLLSRVHAQPPHAGLAPRASGSEAVRDQAARIAGEVRNADSLPPMPAVDVTPPVVTDRLIHGDAVPGNILVTKTGPLMLIDWQCPALGDPVEDVATFLSPAMQHLYRGAVLTDPETTRFLHALPAPLHRRYQAMQPLFHWRMAAHCLWKAERGDDAYAMAATLELSALHALSANSRAAP